MYIEYLPAFKDLLPTKTSSLKLIKLLSLAPVLQIAPYGTKSPIIFVGTGEHLEDIEAFDTQPFVSRLLGLGDWQGLMEKLSDVVPEDQGQKLVDGITSGQFTMRLLYEQFQNITKMGPMSQVMSMIPGMADALPQGSERAGQALSLIHI